MSEIDPATADLQRIANEIDKGTARLGWDLPPTLYALLPTTTLLGEPNLSTDVADQLRADWDGTDSHLSAILQESLGSDRLEEALTRFIWPDTVAGAALCVELLTMPPAVEEEIPTDPEEASAFVAEHPARAEVRFTVTVLRSGQSWCLIRARDYDADDSVASGEELAPGLVQALRMGFTD